MKIIELCYFLILVTFAGTCGGEEIEVAPIKSMHAGFMHPNGVDVFGYSTESPFSNHLYRYYTFGFPSFVAVGITYYSNHSGDGMTASAGTGIGMLNQGDVSLAYQWQLQQSAFLKLGFGFASSIVFNGIFPVIAFELRLK